MNIWTKINNALSVLDTYVWEPLLRRFPILQRLDGPEDWKSWIGHSLVTLVGAYLLSRLPGVTLTVGAWIMVGFYLIREVSARLSLGWGYKRLDGLMDVVGPICVATLTTVIS